MNNKKGSSLNLPEFKVAIDASRIRSGGGIAHLLGILDIARIDSYGIKEVHVWAYRELLDTIPNRSWIIKHHPKVTEQSVIKQLYWQATKLTDEIKAAGCQLLFSVDATTLCRFSPMVVLSQNMLPYEEGIMSEYGFSKNWLHQRILLEIQKRAFRFANAVIFLTQHAANRIQHITGKLKNTTCIAHGVDEIFKKTLPQAQWPNNNERPIRCVYISPLWEYKYQWVVVRAIEILRKKGYDITLTLTGGGNKKGRKMLTDQLSTSDPHGQFVHVLDFVPHREIPQLIADTDIYVFASGCETFGISLLEAMAVGVPIACSNKSSLPETLRDGGEYFDPRDDRSIADAIEKLVNQPELRKSFAEKARLLSESYSWAKCADDTWTYISQTYQKLSHSK